MVQSVLIGLLLLSAVAYLGRLVYKSFTSTGCESACGACGDVDAIMRKIKEKEATVN